ncbi:GNAT family N-acetyltransferase [Rhodococcus sp. NPDC127528]|uniref:GNAT family N-acetyltransferase n=1 Tax=unclassified Rhodococcus (in: high G+C Gram-positive bacteria) TaxID=192944 RepID=UPI0036325424
MRTVHHARLAATDPATLYRIMMLRTAVFVHEQGVVSEPELDGRDLHASTTLFWTEEDGQVVATLRVLADEPTVHIGRVATAVTARGRGIAGELLATALASIPGEVDISAQAYLESWYGRFGFRRTGPNFSEAGIDHVPMRRPAVGPAPPE